MDTALSSTIRDWSIATLSVVAFAFILYTFIKYAFQILTRIQEEHRTDQIWFQGFVNENNHQKTDMIKEHTATLVEVNSNITSNTKAIERLIDKLDK